MQARFDFANDPLLGAGHIFEAVAGQVIPTRQVQ